MPTPRRYGSAGMGSPDSASTSSAATPGPFSCTRVGASPSWPSRWPSPLSDSVNTSRTPSAESRDAPGLTAADDTLDRVPDPQYVASLTRVRVAAGALYRDRQGHVLV